MSYEGFPSRIFFAVIEGNTETDIGSFTMDEDLELSALQIHMVKVGNHNPSDTFKLQLYSENGAFLTESDSFETVDFANVSSGNWFGYVTFAFNRYKLRDGSTYTVKIKSENTTYVDGSRYYGVKLDWPSNINDYELEEVRGLAVSVVGYK